MEAFSEQHEPRSSAPIEGKCCETAQQTGVHVEELAAVGKVLQVLVQQLSGVNLDIEESVTGVSAGFYGMAQRAQAAVAAARSATVGDVPIDRDSHSPLAEIQQVLNKLLADVQSSFRFSQLASEKLAHLEKQLGGVEKVVGEVEGIAGRAKMVALNGRIEASRLGIAGKAFGVVAQETKDLADKAAQTGCAIRQSINELARELFQTTGEIKCRADRDAIELLEMNATVVGLLGKLDQTYQQMTEAMARTAKLSGELQNDIGKAVMSMQFQDRVSQRIAHVVQSLDILINRLDPFCSKADIAETTRVFNVWLGEMQSHYTMDSERLFDSQSTASRTGAHSQTNSSELF